MMRIELVPQKFATIELILPQYGVTGTVAPKQTMVLKLETAPVTIEFILGAGIKGDKGDKGAPGSITDYDPGDITLHYENALI